MGYRLLYDNKILYDVYSNEVIYDATLSHQSNANSYLEFSISVTHSLYNTIKEKSGLVELYFDQKKLFSGEITGITEDTELSKSVTCSGALSYLGDTIVRPYSTIKGEYELTAPATVDGYFQWLIDQHNANCTDSRKQFVVGVNQGSMLDKNNYIYRSSSQYPTTSSEIEDKILNNLGGYLFVRYENNKNILDLYADVHDANNQIIDFGINIVDFSKTVSTDSQYTAVIATGYTPDPPEDDPEKEMDPIDLTTLANGMTSYTGIMKLDDKVYDVNAVRQYGYKEYYSANDNITTYDGLLDYACRLLNTLSSPSLSISVKAVDLALYMNNGYEHLQVGQAARIRSKPHHVDEYLMVNSINVDLQDPSNTEYQLGVSYDTLTGQQSSYLKSLNAGINSSLDSVAALDQTTKNAAKDAKAANEKADQASKDAADATSKANEASTKADAADTKATEASEAAKKAQEDAANAISNAKDAADAAADASKKADQNTEKITLVEDTIKTISGDTSTAIANAKAAKDAADAAKAAADQAQTDANTANTEIGKVQSQVENINKEIGDVKQEATDLRDDLSGQITTVKNTMEADYARKTELSETESTLRNEITESAAGVIRTVSQDYATKTELKTTTDATAKNAQDLTNAINKFNSDVDNLQGQIDGAIETWFYDVDPTATNEPAKNWTTDNLKKVHLGDLYYNTKSGYCWRYQLQNGTYSWSRITDVDVTKALADAAAAQTTANSKKRVFVTTPTPPYDIGDLWVQGSNGDIMRCQTAKSSSQSYAAADWVKASKYTDDTAVTNLSNTVEKTYSTKSEVKQLSDQVSSVVSSVEEVKVNAEAAQTSANNAKKAADDAAAAAKTAKDNAATAQAKADEAAKNLATAEANLKNLQSQADATDEQVAAAKAEVEKAKTAAANAQADATTAKNNAATAQATADTAQTNAKKAQDDVNALKNRVTTAETSIKQNSEQIALRATKTEVTDAIDNISVGGRNWAIDTKNFDNVDASSYGHLRYEPNGIWASIYDEDHTPYTNFKRRGGAVSGISDSIEYRLRCKPGEIYTFSFYYQTDKPGKIRTYCYGPGTYIPTRLIGETNGSVTGAYGDGVHDHTLNSDGKPHRAWATYELSSDYTGSIFDKYFLIRTDSSTKGAYIYVFGIKIEKGNKPTDWSPAPEDLEADATTKANNALASAKSYSDSQLTVKANEITQSVNSIKSTTDSLGTRMTTAEAGIKNNADAITLRATKSELTSGLATKPNSNQTSISYPLYISQGSDKYWVRIGRLTMVESAHVTTFHVFSGGGYNGRASQNTEFWITIKKNNGATSSIFGTTVDLGVNSTNVKVKIFSDSNSSCNVWVYLPWAYSAGQYEIQGMYNKWEPNTNADNQANEPSPSGQTAEDVSIRTIAPTSYVDAQIKVTADSINSTVSSVKTTAENAASTASTANNTANSVKSDLANNYTKKTLPDTRLVNQNPQWYMTNYPRQIITEFKNATTIGVSGETYATLETTVPWTDSSGGYPKQRAQCGGKVYWRIGTSNTAWSAWKDTLDASSASTTYATKTEVKQTSDSLTTTITTVKSTADTAKSTADSALTKANTAASDASSAKSTASTLKTLIRQSGDGVEVAKKVNGSYTSTKSLIDDEGLHIIDTNSEKIIAGLKKDKITLLEPTFSLETTKWTDTSVNKIYDSSSIFSSTGFHINTSNPPNTSTEASKVFSSFNLNSQGYGELDIHCYYHPQRNDGFQQRFMIDNRNKRIAFITDGKIAINDNNLEDFVVAQGTSGIWYYRKWNSGIAECWSEERNLQNANDYFAYCIFMYPFDFKTVRMAIPTLKMGQHDYNETTVSSVHLSDFSTSGSSVWIGTPNGVSGTIAEYYTTRVWLYLLGTWK